jgi:hypothetical protein
VSLLGDAARDAATRRAGTLQRVAAEAVDIQPSPTGAIVGLSAGGRIEADRVVLAVGNFPPSDRRSPTAGSTGTRDTSARRGRRRRSPASRATCRCCCSGPG